MEVVPDGWRDSFTLILPEVHVAMGEEAPIDIFGMRTRTKTSVGGPALVKGQLASYRVIEFKGTARCVVF